MAGARPPLFTRLTLGCLLNTHRYQLLEFGALVVDGTTLVEVPGESFDTLVRPRDLNAITKRSMGCNHIHRTMAARAPPFHAVAAHIHAVLHGRIWAGHNIVAFDMKRIAECFTQANLRYGI